MKKLKVETSHQMACRLFETGAPTEEQRRFCEYKLQILMTKKINKLIKLTGK